MTEKQEFLEKLRDALVVRDISDNDIAPYIERFDRFYDRMVNDSEAANGNLLGDIERIADNIAEQISERYDEINRLAERTLTVERVKVSEDASDDVENETKTDSGDTNDATDEGSAQTGLALTEAEAPAPSDSGTVSSRPEYVDEEPAPNSTIFWVLFAVSLPLTIPLGLAALALFLIVWAALAAMIIVSIALVICGAASGTALSLVGIIYGISQLFSCVPIGLYELGLGVLAGSAAMLVCILLYNFAIRLLPLLIKLVGRLFRYLWGRLRVLFVFLRKECAKL